jgi:hypothetical protein
MTTPDRTEELVRAMLERRAGGTVPDWLLSATMHDVVTSRQSRRRQPGVRGGANGARVVLVAAVALALLALGSVLAAGALLRRDDGPLDPPAVVVLDNLASAAATIEPLEEDAATPSRAGASPAAPATPAASLVAATPVPTPDGDAPDPVAGALARDQLARVTDAGAGLRVRTRPSLGASYDQDAVLEPGTRVFVVDGPIRADGHEWYEVLTEDVGLWQFGWVAAGDQGEAWLEPAAAECVDDPGTRELDMMWAAEFLVCYGDRPVHVLARINDGLGPLSEGTTVRDILCPTLPAVDDCGVAEGWLLIPETGLLLDQIDAFVDVAIAPDGLRLEDIPSDTSLEFAIAMDSPSAADCRVVDQRTGSDHIPRDEAVTQCRLHFVLVDVER